MNDSIRDKIAMVRYWAAVGSVARELAGTPARAGKTGGREGGGTPTIGSRTGIQPVSTRGAENRGSA